MKRLGIPVHWAQLPPCTCSMLSIWVIRKLLLSISRLLCIHKVIPSENPKLLFTSPQILTGLNSLKTVENEWSCQIQIPAESCPLTPAHTTDRKATMRVQHFLLSFLKLIIYFPVPASPFVPPTHPSTDFSDLCFLFLTVILSSLSARLKTRRRPWKRPRPTPPSLWPAWPTRSMP